MQTQDTATPTIPAARRAIIDEVIRECIAVYEQAKRAYARVHRDAAGDRELDDILQVTVDRLLATETHLVRAILASAPGYTPSQPEKHIQPSRGVRCDGRLYLVTPAEPDADTWTRFNGDIVVDDHGEDVMQLEVIDESQIADAGTIADRPEYRPGGPALEHVEDLDDAGADDRE